MFKCYREPLVSKKGFVFCFLFMSVNLKANINSELELNTVASIPGQYVVKLKGNSKNLTKESLEKTLQGTVLKKLKGFSNAVLLQRSQVETKKSALSFLNKNIHVAYAEPNFIYLLNKDANDPYMYRLWGLDNQGQFDPGGQTGIPGNDLNIKKAWDITTGSKEVLVAVVDSGVDYTNAEIKNNVWQNEIEKNGKVGIDDDGNGYIDDIYGYDFVNQDSDPQDDSGHGTHVAGTIAAEGNNGIGISGVSWQASLMIIKAFDSKGHAELANLVEALDYATMMGAQLSNNSWGGRENSQALFEAIQRTEKAGSIFVSSAGNSGTNNDRKDYYPSSYEIDNIISVAGHDNRGMLTRSSCFGKLSVDIAAPGKDILSITPFGLYSLTGTSMAAPHVSGAIILLLSQEPNLKPFEVRDRMILTAKKTKYLESKVVSGGMLDAHSLLVNKPSN